MKPLVFFALALATGLAQAATVSQTVSGTIGFGSYGDTTDKYGLFGSAGADLNGDVVTVSYSYNTAAFTLSPNNCGQDYGTDDCNEYNSSTPASASLSFKANGVTQSYSLTSEAILEFLGYSDRNPKSNFFSEDVDTLASGPGGSLTLYTASPVAFGDAVTLTPGSGNPSSFTFYTDSGIETLVFTPGAGTSAPEPASAALLFGGFACLALMSRSLRRARV